jgi:hypothetical protein
MDLTAEEKQRIEEEERRRVSEEEYRAEVRAKLQRKPAPQQPSVPWLIGAALVLVIGTLIAWSISSSNHANAKSVDAAKSVARPVPVPVLRTRYVPVGQNIAKGQIAVGARGFAQYQFTISPEMLQPVFAGDFTVSGGGGNDIMAVIADEDNYTNWINGHQARVYWTTQGRETTGQFKVRLPPGTYHLAFSNKFSLFAPKQVSVTAYLNYQKAETYYDDPTAPVSCPVPPCTGTGNSPGANPAAGNN